MTKTLLRIIFLALLGLVLVLGCGEKKQVKEEPRYQIPDGWVTYTYEDVKMIYPPDHPLAGTVHDFAVWYSWALRTDCRFLQIPVPVDTLIVFWYTGHFQGNEMTHHYYPWADSVAIHFWLPSFKGPTLMQFLLPYWLDKKPQFKFLREGMIALLDYSNQNYHETTWHYYQHDSLISLEELAKDTTVDSNKERYQSAEAASFVDFFVINYGMRALRLLYRAETDWGLATRGILHVEPDSLQTQWIDFVGKVVKGEWVPPGQDSAVPADLPFNPEDEG